MSKLLRRLLRCFGIDFLKTSTLRKLEDQYNDTSKFDLEMLKAVKPELRNRFIEYMHLSNSQRRQDLFVASELQFKFGGYFVEFGATDGNKFSNTLLLEKEFGWSGILVEPGRCWKDALVENRPQSQIDFSCVWRESGKSLEFLEAHDPELSTIGWYESKDFHANFRKRKSSKNYRVETISLKDLLQKYQVSCRLLILCVKDVLLLSP